MKHKQDRIHPVWWIAMATVILYIVVKTAIDLATNYTPTL